MDTDHPVFQVAAPEYIDSAFDVLIENVAERWSKVKDLGRSDALRIVREESVKIFTCQYASPSVSGGPTHIHFQHMVATIKDAAAPLVIVDALCYAFGMMQMDGDSMESIATRHRISRQAFSKTVQRIQQDFGITPRSGMRPTAQRKVYRDVHRERWSYIDQDQSKLNKQTA